MTYKNKLCNNCNQEFTPTAPANIFCQVCAPIIRAEKDKIKNERYYAKKGRRVGIGSGGLQKERLGELSPSFKTGIGIYREIMKRNNIPFICNHCNKNLDSTKPFEWCTHHKDGNRHNNDISNLEYLCKRCHQLEHECWDALGIEIDNEDLESMKEWARSRNK